MALVGALFGVWAEVKVWLSIEVEVETRVGVEAEAEAGVGVLQELVVMVGMEE